MSGGGTSRATIFATNLTTLLLVLSVGWGLLTIASSVTRSTGLYREITVHQSVETSRLGSLPPTVVRPTRVPVIVRIPSPSRRQQLMAAGRDLSYVALTVAIMWLLRALLRSVRQGDPFGATNVRRLRRLGFLLVVGGPVAVWVTSRFEAALAASTSIDGLGAGFSIPAAWLLTGLGVFVLAEVVAHGVRLREDVEGTV